MRPAALQGAGSDPPRASEPHRTHATPGRRRPALATTNLPCLLLLCSGNPRMRMPPVRSRLIVPSDYRLVTLPPGLPVLHLFHRDRWADEIALGVVAPQRRQALPHALGLH